MREIKEISSGSYSGLVSDIKRFVQNIPLDKTIEAISMLYDADGNTSNQHKAIIIVK